MSTPSENPSFKSELANQLGVLESLLPENIDSKLSLQDARGKAYIEELKAKLATLKTDRERSVFFEQKLQNVSFSEATERLQSGVQDVQKSLNTLAPEAIRQTVDATENQLKTEMTRSGMDAAKAVNDLANSKNSGEVTTNIGKIADIAKSAEGVLNTAMGTIGNLLKKLLEMTGFGKIFSYFGFSFDNENKETAPSSTQKATQTTLENTAGNISQSAEQKARETIGTPENIAEKMKIAKEKYWGMLERNGWIREPAKQRQAFDRLWGERSSEMQAHLEKVSTAAMNNGEWNVMTDIFEPGVFGPVRFLLQLVIRGVIPKEAIFSTVLDLSKGTIKLGFQTAESLIHGTPEKTAQLIGEFASTDLTKLSSEEKSLILASVHHNMALTLAIAGKMAQATGAIALMPLYWEQGSGVHKLKAFGNGITGDFVAAGKNMDSMLSMLGDVDPNSPARKYYDEMLAVVREVQLKSELTAKYMEMQKAGKTYTQISDELRSLVSGSGTTGHRFFGIGEKTKESYLKMLSELPKNQGEGSLLAFLENKNHVSKQNIVSKVGQLMGSSVGANPAEIRITQTIEQSSNVGKGLSEVVKNKESLWKIYSKMHLAMKFEEFIAAMDRGVLPIVAQDTNKAKEIMQRFMRAIPPGFDHFFSSLAVVLTIAHVSSSDDKLKTLGQDIAMMNPLWGGYIFIQEGLTMQGTQMEKTGYLLVGGTVMSIGMFQIAKIIGATGSARYAAISELALGPIHTFGRGIGALARGASYASLFARNVEKPGAIRPFIQPKALGSYAMIAALFIYWGYSHHSEEKKTEFLTKEKLLKPDGTYDMAILRSKFGSLPEATRSELLEKILNQELASQGVSATVSQGGKQTVVNGVSRGSDIPPVSIDTFYQISEMMKEVGGRTGSIYLSQSATEATKKYIAALPVSDIKKKEFMAQFGIPA